ncbi:MAG: N-acetylmuramoyl-L-alanine amidase [Akkermansia sp.]|nr:N-acetylmuramoyl-L-alanine amidase [Akkermansia sp.]
MVRRGQVIALICMLLACMFGCQQQSKSSYLKRPPVYKFKAVTGPIIPRSLGKLAKEVNIKVRMMPSNSLQRKKSRRMRPTFLTIHSTANHSSTATAMQHSRALCRGAFNNRNWHFTVDQYMAVQNIPLNETAWHAGSAAGNHNSIGIEMCECENRGHNHFRTWDRTAKLAALLMKRYKINLRRVVPHYHWTGKNCPTPLLTNGRPGPKWAWFLSRVDYYYRCINKGVSFR